MSSIGLETLYDRICELVDPCLDKMFVEQFDKQWRKPGPGKSYEKALKVRLDTDRYIYYVNATERMEELGYLGAVCTTQLPRPGECWRRGNDLPDGPLTSETWSAILKAILRSEFVPIYSRDKEIESFTATFTVLIRSMVGAYMAIEGLTQEHAPWPSTEETLRKWGPNIKNGVTVILQSLPVRFYPSLLVSDDSLLREVAKRAYDQFEIEQMCRNEN